MRLFEVENPKDTEDIKIDLGDIYGKSLEVIHREMNRLKVRLGKTIKNEDEIIHHIISNAVQELSEISISKTSSLNDKYLYVSFKVKDDMIDVSEFRWYQEERISKNDIEYKTQDMILRMIETQTTICMMSV